MPPFACMQGIFYFLMYPSLFLPCSVVYLRELTHIACISQTPVSPALPPDLAKERQWWESKEKGGEKSECYLGLAQIVSLLHLQLSLHRSTLLLASVQRLQLTPALLEPHLFVSVDWGGGGFLSG